MRGCDPSCGPPSSGRDPRKIDKPNPVKLPTGTWVSVSIKYPALVVCLANPGGGLVAIPEMEKGNTTEVYTSTGEGVDRVLYLHAPGDWRIRNTGTTEITALVLDAYDGLAALFWGGVKITGGSVAVHPSSTVPIVMSAPAVVSVGAASALALAANTNRKFVYFRNIDAAKVISLAFDNGTAVNGSGVVLNPGDAVSMHAPGEAPTTGQVNAIASAASANLAIQEGV